MWLLRLYFRHRNVAARIERHRQQRDQLALELDEMVRHAGWDRLDDDPLVRREGAEWARHADVLRRAIDRLDREILRLHLEEL